MEVKHFDLFNFNVNLWPSKMFLTIIYKFIYYGN